MSADMKIAAAISATEQRDAMDGNKKMTAAISAVMQYLRAEEEMAGLASAVSPLPQRNAWGLSGRKAQMEMRAMMGMKAFHGKRLIRSVFKDHG